MFCRGNGGNVLGVCEETLTFEIQALDALIDALFRHHGYAPDHPTVEAAAALRAEKLARLRELAGIEAGTTRRGGTHLRLVA